MDYFIKRSTCVACTIDLNAMYIHIIIFRKLRKIYRCKKCHQDVCANCSTNRIWVYYKLNKKSSILLPMILLRTILFNKEYAHSVTMIISSLKNTSIPIISSGTPRVFSSTNISATPRG